MKTRYPSIGPDGKLLLNAAHGRRVTTIKNGNKTLYVLDDRFHHWYARQAPIGDLPAAPPHTPRPTAATPVAPPSGDGAAGQPEPTPPAPGNSINIVELDDLLVRAEALAALLLDHLDNSGAAPGPVYLCRIVLDDLTSAARLLRSSP